MLACGFLEWPLYIEANLSYRWSLAAIALTNALVATCSVSAGRRGLNDSPMQVSRHA